MEQNLCEFPPNTALVGFQLNAELANCRPLGCELSRLLVCKLDNPQATLPMTWDLNMTSSEEQQVVQEKWNHREC